MSLALVRAACRSLESRQRDRWAVLGVDSLGEGSVTEGKLQLHTNLTGCACAS